MTHGAHMTKGNHAQSAWHDILHALFDFYSSKYVADIDSSHMWQESGDIRAFRMYTKYDYM